MMNTYFNGLFAEVTSRMGAPAFSINDDGYGRCDFADEFSIDTYADNRTGFLYLSSKLGTLRKEECRELLLSFLRENFRNSKPFQFYFAYEKTNRDVLVFSSLQTLNLNADLLFNQVQQMQAFLAGERLRLIDEISFEH